MAESSYKVLVHQKSGTTTCALTEGRDVVFGREAGCTVVLADARVSRRHAVLRLLRDEIQVSDLGSRNGTHVDGRRIEAKTFVPVRATSVIRIGDAVLVFEVAHARPAEHWCFDAAAFGAKAAAILADARSKKATVGLLDIRWEQQDTVSTSTASNVSSGASSMPLRQLLARIAGPDGVVGAHESSGLVLLCPNTDAGKLEASAALVRQLCAERSVPVAVKSALSGTASSVQDLLLQASRGAGGAAPPVVFQGGLYSLEKLVSRLDSSDASVLIVGETGVGKDVLARSLHGRSRRSSRPYVALNCAAFTEALFESELFGHEKGAFTGAAQVKTGLLESAAGGTVFLDEVGEMPLGLQAKLLRVVENREILRVGGLQPRPIDVRFIFATNRDLRKEIENKTFRSDLYFRISTVSLRVPPLRDRVDEIVPLALHFAEISARRIGRPVPVLLEEAKQFLKGHAWPGNVRELKNVMELAVLVHDGDAIRPADIHIEPYIPVDASEPIGPVSTPFSPLEARTSEHLPPPSSERRLPITSKASSPLSAPASYRRVDPETERAHILAALEKTFWNQSEAAKLLGMPRRTFVKRLAQYNVPRPRKRET